MWTLRKKGELVLWKNYCQKLAKTRPLSYLFWETTLRCNLNCRHCGSSCGPKDILKDELSEKEIKKAFFDIAQSFNPKKIMVAVTGGEPLLRQDVFEVMKYASDLGFTWGMVTNGMLITPKTIEKMKWSKMAVVSVSLDGLKENHNWLRNNETAFERTIEGIKLLVNSKAFSIVEAITCVNKRNIKELENIYDLCSKLNVTNWRLFSICPIGRAKDNAELFLTGPELRYLLDFIKEKRVASALPSFGGPKKNKKRKLKISFCEEGFLGLEYEGETRDQLFRCLAGVVIASILYNGDIGACPILPREHTTQGNVRKDNFADVWKTKYKIFRNRDWCKKGECQHCQWWDFCEGNSLHLWDFNDKKLMLCHYYLMNNKN